MNSRISARNWSSVIARNRRIVLSGLVFTVLMAVAWPVSYAQVQLPRQGGIPVGKFLFYPSLDLELGHTSNVLYASEDLENIPSGVVVARANLMMDMPLGANDIRWSYSPQFKDYTSDRFVSGNLISHFFDFESRFQVGRSFSIGIADRYVRGVTELQEVDPGNELIFGLTPFRLHAPVLDLEFLFGARQRLTVSPAYKTSRFEDPVQALFLDYNTKALNLRYGFRISPPSEFFFFYAREETQQARTTIFYDETLLLTDAAGVGFTRSVNDNVVTSFSTAYTEVAVEGDVVSKFNGLSFEATGNWRLTDGMQVEVSGLRRPFQSFFLNNAFYVNNALSARLIQQIGARTYWRVEGRYQVNDYAEGVDGSLTGDDSWVPSEGVKRHDIQYGMEIGVSYRFTSSLRTFIGYEYRARNSNMRRCAESPDLGQDPNDGICEGEIYAPYSFNNRRIIFRLETGWL